MSASPLGKNRKAMWQSMVMSIIHRLHQDDVRAATLHESMVRVALEADFMLDEMDKRFTSPQPEPKESSRPTITLRR